MNPNTEAEKSFPVPFNQNETTVLLNLLDIAVKAAGRQAAGAVAHFEQKFQAAIDANKKPILSSVRADDSGEPDTARVTEASN